MAAALRGKKTRIFRDTRSGSSTRCRWEVQRAAAGLETDALWQLRCAAKDLRPEGLKGLAAIGLKAAAKAVEKDQALVVFVCVEGVPTVLMQHLPILCALKKIPVAVVASTPEMLGSASAPFRPKQKDLHATAICLLKACRHVKRLAELVEHLEGSLPAVRVPFLRSASEAFQREKEDLQVSKPEPLEEASKIPEEFIQLQPERFEKGFKGKGKGKGKAKSKTVAPETPVERMGNSFNSLKRAREALQGSTKISKISKVAAAAEVPRMVSQLSPVQAEDLPKVEQTAEALPDANRAEAEDLPKVEQPPKALPDANRAEVEQPPKALPDASAEVVAETSGQSEANAMSIFDFFDGMDN